MNPYAPPQFGDLPSSYRANSGPPPFPVFVTVILVMDLALLALRAVFVMLALVTLTNPALQNPMIVQTGWFEVACGLVMMLTGVPADIALLARQRWGIWLAYAKVAGTLGSIAVGVWQASYMMEQLAPGSPEFIGGIIGGAIATGSRLMLTGLYIFAQVQFSNWARQSAEASASRQ